MAVRTVTSPKDVTFSWGTVPAELLHYQVFAACGSGGEQEGP